MNEPLMQLVVLFVLFSIGFGILIWIYSKAIRISAIKKLDVWLDGYRLKVSVDNRILLNRGLIVKAFPEYGSTTHSYMWKYCKKENWVRLDTRDNEWILVP